MTNLNYVLRCIDKLYFDNVIGCRDNTNVNTVIGCRDEAIL